MTRKLAVAVATLLAISAPPALAGQAVTLKASPVDSDGVVTLGDLFDGAGAAETAPLAAKPGASVVLDAGVVQAVARRNGLDWSNAEGIRRIIVRSGAPGPAAAKGNVEVLTYARSLSAGEMVQPQDLVWAKAAATPLDAPRDADAVIGMTTRRPLAAGAAVSIRDVVAPKVIRNGDIITVTYQDNGISVSMTGKATADAAVGETLGIQNTASKKVIPAIAAGPGLALIGPGAEQLRAERRYALR
jgi:flagella basal body P-ring formation protein FlgA